MCVCVAVGGGHSVDVGVYSWVGGATGHVQTIAVCVSVSTWVSWSGGGVALIIFLPVPRPVSFASQNSGQPVVVVVLLGCTGGPSVQVYTCAGRGPRGGWVW